MTGEHEIQSNSVRSKPKGDYGTFCRDRAHAYKIAIYAMNPTIPNGRAAEMMRDKLGMPSAIRSDVFSDMLP